MVLLVSLLSDVQNLNSTPVCLLTLGMQGSVAADVLVVCGFAFQKLIQIFPKEKAPGHIVLSIPTQCMV